MASLSKAIPVALDTPSRISRTSGDFGSSPAHSTQAESEKRSFRWKALKSDKSIHPVLPGGAPFQSRFEAVMENAVLRIAAAGPRNNSSTNSSASEAVKWSVSVPLNEHILPGEYSALNSPAVLFRLETCSK